MFLLNLLIFFSLSNEGKGNDQKLAKNLDQQISEEQSANSDKKDGYNLRYGNPEIVREEWMKKKLEIHRKLSEIEARHHEEEVEDEEDTEHLKKIEKIIDEELNKSKFYQEYERSIQDEVKELEEAVLPTKEKTVEPTKRLLDKYYDDLDQNKLKKEEKSTKNQIKFTSHQVVSKTIDVDKNKLNQNVTSKSKQKFYLISISMLIAVVLLYLIKGIIYGKELDELPNSIKYK